jgi:hypothetical protein
VVKWYQFRLVCLKFQGSSQLASIHSIVVNFGTVWCGHSRVSSLTHSLQLYSLRVATLHSCARLRRMNVSLHHVWLWLAVVGFAAGSVRFSPLYRYASKHVVHSQVSAEAMQHERLLRDHLQLLQQHAQRHRVAGASSNLRRAVAAALQLFPSNPEFLTLFIASESRCRVAGEPSYTRLPWQAWRCSVGQGGARQDGAWHGVLGDGMHEVEANCPNLPAYLLCSCGCYCCVPSPPRTDDPRPTSSCTRAPK